MAMQRRSIIATAAITPTLAWLNSWADSTGTPSGADQSTLLLSNFQDGESYVLPGGGWRGFSDRVMGGISNASLDSSTIGGKGCIRLTGNVTRESNGGFIQMALYFGRDYKEYDASAYKGIELLVHGNNEDYNLHVRTSDCGWHDESYRMTFYAKPEWQRVRVPWDAFQANNVRAPLDSSQLQRIALLGWMREFKADIALAQISLYS
jgi:hypothetical protein